MPNTLLVDVDMIFGVSFCDGQGSTMTTWQPFAYRYIGGGSEGHGDLTVTYSNLSDPLNIQTLY